MMCAMKCLDIRDEGEVSFKQDSSGKSSRGCDIWPKTQSKRANSHVKSWDKNNPARKSNSH